MAREEEDPGVIVAGKTRCPNCKKPCESFEELGHHLRLEHAKWGDFLCLFCLRDNSKDYRDLRKHIRGSHQVELLPAGTRFGALVIHKPVIQDKKYGLLWDLVCDCGKQVRGWETELRKGQRQACDRCTDPLTGGPRKAPQAPTRIFGDNPLVAAKPHARKNEAVSPGPTTLLTPGGKPSEAAQPPARNFPVMPLTGTTETSELAEDSEAAQPPGDDFPDEGDPQTRAKPARPEIPGATWQVSDAPGEGKLFQKAAQPPAPKFQNGDASMPTDPLTCTRCGDPQKSKRCLGQHKRYCKSPNSKTPPGTPQKSPSLREEGGGEVLPCGCNPAKGQAMFRKDGTRICACGTVWKLQWVKVGVLEVKAGAPV